MYYVLYIYSNVHTKYYSTRRWAANTHSEEVIYRGPCGQVRQKKAKKNKLSSVQAAFKTKTSTHKKY
jgi:hypothetical protein